MDRPRISIVAPVFNEEETLPEFYRRVRAVMDGLGEPWELVLVDVLPRTALGKVRRQDLPVAEGVTPPGG